MIRLGLGIRNKVITTISRRPLDPSAIAWPFDIGAWLEEMGPSQWVLDLGSGQGSFPWSGRFPVVALDNHAGAFPAAATGAPRPYHCVAGIGDRLPFRDASFDLIVCHHALEHMTPVEPTLREMARVLKPEGRLYIAVPNGYGLCDAIYRFVFEGGEHVNRFRRQQLVGLVESLGRVRLVRWHKLYSSFGYLRRLMLLAESPPPDAAKRPVAIGRHRRALAAAQWILYMGTRLTDRVLHTDLAVYGWALYFDGSGAPPREEPAYLNVCLLCGAGHHAQSAYRPFPFCFRCNVCSRLNPYTRPFRNTR